MKQAGSIDRFSVGFLLGAVAVVAAADACDSWVAKKFRKGVANIGNAPTIRGDCDPRSKNMMRNAIEKGWWPADKGESFDFALADADPQTQLAANLIRGKQVASVLDERHGRIDVEWMFRISRDHPEEAFLDGPFFKAAIPDFLTVCMHDSPANFTWGITAATNVFVLPGKDAEIVPVAYYSANVPCCSVFSAAKGGRGHASPSHRETSQECSRRIATPDSGADPEDSHRSWATRFPEGASCADSAAL